MDAEQAEFLQTSPLIQRLDRRRIQPGVINLSRYSSESTGVPDWIVQRSALVNQLQSRDNSFDRPASDTELALAMASPVPTVQSHGSEVSLGGAISSSDPQGVAPSLPIVTASSVEPLPMSQTTPVIAPRSVIEPDVVPNVVEPSLSAPEKLVSEVAPLVVSVSEPAISSSDPQGVASISEPMTQYRIRRFVNPTTQPAIQRKPSSDQPSSEASLVQSSSEGGSIAPDASPSANVDDRPLPTSDSVPINPVAPMQSGDSATETMLLRQVSDQLDAPTTVTSISQETSAPAQSVLAIARPIVPSASLSAIVQRTNLSQPTDNEFNRQEPLVLSSSYPQGGASALSISKLPLQPSLMSLEAGSNQVQRRSQSELPLAMIRPFVQPAMSDGHSETIARQETGTAAIASSTTPRFDPPSPLTPSTSQISVGQIAEQVSRILCRQLTVERERRGTNQWS
ncbi:hypothetical protein [Phormidesmis priestleyi]